jgi:hypothetical protein
MVGAQKAGVQIDQIGQAVTLIAGSGLMAASHAAVRRGVMRFGA